jgi:hypothetical protein
MINMDQPSAEGNFCDIGDGGGGLKLPIVECYNKHMGYVNQSNQVANESTCLQTPVPSLHLLDFTILNSLISLSSYAAQHSH